MGAMQKASPMDLASTMDKPTEGSDTKLGNGVTSVSHVKGGGKSASSGA